MTMPDTAMPLPDAASLLETHLRGALAPVADWQRRFGPALPAPEETLAPERLAEVLAALGERLTADNYPFHHPRYAGQMLKPPHPVAMLAYMATMLINPNNHALDGGPATAALEKEAVAALAGMFGFAAHLGHLSASGTIANLEALWVGRALAPGRAIAHGAFAHYTHARMAEVLGLPAVSVAADARGRMSLDALEEALAGGRIGTVVATAGTTGLGAVDPIDRIVPLARRYGARVHVDAAYGGFYRLLAEPGAPEALAPEDAAAFRAIAGADSVVVDPHKHGLQPYGCGAVLFADPGVGRLYSHDSPYTYFTSAELHLGEISLECSRSGAAAAAFWATLQAFPLEAAAGFGPILGACRGAARRFTAALTAAGGYAVALPPALDIVVYWPLGGGAAAISAAAERVFEALMRDPEAPVYLAKIRLPRAWVETACPGAIAWGDETELTALRSCFLKPSHLAAAESLAARLTAALPA